MGGRLVASRLIAVVSAWYVVWSGSKWTVTLAYPATSWRTSRLFFSAAASAMARVLRAVSRRVPSSARSAESPNGWVLPSGVEGGAGMCAHKNSVEDAGHEAGADQSHASQADCPAGDDGGGGEIPGREVVFDRVDGAWKIDVFLGAPGAREAGRRVRHVEQQKQSPGQGEEEGGHDVRVELRKRDVGHVPQVGAIKPVGERVDRNCEGGGQDDHRERRPEAVGEEAGGEGPCGRSLGGIRRRRPSGCDGVAEEGDEGDGQQKHCRDAGQPR